MKKLFVFMFALAMGLCITSCKQKAGEAAPADTEQAAQAEEAQQDPVEVMKNLVEKAKAEGANWSIDQWKDAYKQAMIAMKPMLNQLGELTSSVTENSDPAQIAEMMTKAKKMEEDFKPLQTVMNEFEEIAKSTENGKAINDDEEWGKALMKELGINFDL
jgi:type VI protein secretion system component VasK